MKTRKLILPILIFPMLCLGSTRYVNIAATGSNDGTNWDNAYTNLQTAVTASIAGDLILVTNGVYAPISTGNKAITIQSVNGSEFTKIEGTPTSRCASLGTGVVIDGFTFFNGGSASYAANGGGVYLGTVLNSVITNCAVSTAGYLGGGVCDAVMMSNIVVVGCTARRGGGIYGGTVIDSIVCGNYAETSGGGVNLGSIYDSVISNNVANTSGGGIYAATLVSNCTVIANTARNSGDTTVGGGINGGTVLDSRIIGNIATNNLARGGGIVNATVRNCYIYNNRARAGGGTSACTIYDSNIVSNSAKYSDGGVGYLSNIYNSTIEYNTADSANGGGGGGITSLRLSNCVVRCNSAPTVGGIGGATLWNCVISNNVATTTIAGGLNGCVAIDSLIAGNSANTTSGGLYNSAATNCIIRGNASVSSGGGTYASILSRCSIIGNSAAGTSTGGGSYSGSAYSCFYTSNTAYRGSAMAGTIPAVNCIMVANTSGQGGITYDGIFLGCTLVNNICGLYSVWNGTYRNCIIFDTTPSPSGNTITYSALTAPYTGTGNITNNPQFVNSATNDFRLKPTSPCINRGANQYVTTTTDFAGSPRIKNQRVDMGAYEVQAYRDTMIPNGLYPMGVKIGRLPAGYTECAYLESTGTQWIDAGIATITTNSSYKIDFTVVSVLPTTMYGVWGSYNDVKYCGYVGFGMPLLTTYYGGNGYVPTTNSFPITMVGKRVVWNQNRLVANYTVDGTGYTRTYTATDAHTTNDFRLFSTAGITDGSNTRIYSFSYLDGNTLVRRFIPALDVYGTPCMYDTVTKTPFYNQGTGEFLYQIKQ